MNAPELLAPARDLKCGITAISCGADAVYIGAPRFGARKDAGNSVADIAALAEFAHRYFCRVYVTVNTLLHDAEIPAAAALVRELYDVGVDGVIIQDFGLLEAGLPPIPLIASTQMNNMEPDHVLFLEKVGFKRAILARELSIEQVAAIRARAKEIELECFVHGALCVSYSGRCYLSYALGGRSGNRGECAQPCRKPYRLVDGLENELAKGYLLSLKDMNRSEVLEGLTAAGISSFKIEGRLKDSAYIANVVSHYRRKLDAIIERSGGLLRDSIVFDFTPDLTKTFNRGFTDYFASSDGSMGSVEKPAMVGEEVGTVVAVAKGGMRLSTETALHAGDGVCYLGKSGQWRGTRVQKVGGGEVTLLKTAELTQGATLYRNRDHEWLARIQRTKTQRKIPVKIRMGEDDGGVFIEAGDRLGTAAKLYVEEDLEAADKPENARTAILRQLAKTGQSEFLCEEVRVDLKTAPFMRVSTLNDLRRRALEALRQARKVSFKRDSGIADANDYPYPEKELSFEGNVINRHARRFFERHGVEKIAPGAETGLDLRAKRVMTCLYCIKRELEACQREDPKREMKAPLFLVDERGHRLELEFDCERCRMSVWFVG